MPRHFGDAAAAGEARPQPAEAPAGRAERVILVVEDEEQVREMTVEALRDLGYTVVEAPDGATALARLETLERVDLLFTDIVMPGMNGRELADRVCAARPGTPVLFTTGYTRNAVVHNGMLDPGVAFLAKPFTIDQLARKVAEAVAADPPPTEACSAPHPAHLRIVEVDHVVQLVHVAIAVADQVDEGLDVERELDHLRHHRLRDCWRNCCCSR